MNSFRQHELVGGLVYCDRMLDELRMYARGQLPPEYVERLGMGPDGHCCEFPGVLYDELMQTVLVGRSDDVALTWCFKYRRNL